ncbi:MAG: AAA family ATPase [Oligoflexia bacterium]|nr:AAA family ATPase [Oligoflexia bacterium]
MEKAQNWLLSFKGDEDLRCFDNELKDLSYKRNKALTISIASGKGGVGKTSISVKMAKELSLLGNKVLLIDCDYNLSNTLLKLNLPLNNNFYDFITSEKSFFDCINKIGNLHVLAGCNGHVELFENNIHFDKLVIDIINEYDQFYDYIIMDSPGGLSKSILNINAFCEHRLIIVTPDKSSITDSYSLIKLLKLRYGIRDNFLIVNRYVADKQYERVVKTISNTIKNFLSINTHVLGGLREHDNKLESFDSVLINDKNSKLHQNFLKILRNYHDQYGKRDIAIAEAEDISYESSLDANTVNRNANASMYDRKLRSHRRADSAQLVDNHNLINNDLRGHINLNE